MIEIRSFDSLGSADHGWLKARHHFAFGHYIDRARMGWGNLRVWNDDEIAPGAGFPAHPHADMEIITYVRDGAITHRDSTGNQGRTVEGDVQVMSAGSGIRHSEYNLEAEPTRIFQIWIQPRERGGAPSWGTRPFPRDNRAGRFVTLASGLPGDEEALPIRAEARVMAANLAAGSTTRLELDPTRHTYLVAAKGRMRVAGQEAAACDGVAITGEHGIEIEALEDCELILVDAA